MMGLYALACHLAGDFPLQSNRMAANKFDSPSVRAQHCAVYTAACLPLAALGTWGLARTAVFALLVFASHFVIDTRRWYEATDAFPTRPLWFDQTFHVVALAMAVGFSEVIV